MEFLILLIVIIILWLILKPYFIKYDNLVSFTGGLGSGKTFMSTSTALVLYRKQRFKVFVHNLLKPWEKWDKPQLYCNIPLKINRRRSAIILEREHLLLQKRIVPRSVVVLDEVDCFANQFLHDNPCIVNKKGGETDGNFDEFCRFYRHYTKGGYLIFNTQATANENLVIRRRQNTVLQLFHFRTWGIPLIWPKIFYTVKCRNVTMSDDVKTVEENNAEDNMRLVIGFMPLMRHYDTYCYSGRYETVPYLPERAFARLKTNECLRAPVKHVEKLTNPVNPPDWNVPEDVSRKKSRAAWRLLRRQQPSEAAEESSAASVSERE